MSVLGGIDISIIDNILGNLPIGAATRNELRSFLNGRVTTVTEPEEFSGALKSVAQDIETGTFGAAGAEGSAMGEIIGAIEGGGLVGLEGGLIIAKGQEIADELRTLLRGSQNEQDSINSSRQETRAKVERGVIFGPNAVPTGDHAVLIQGIKNFQRAARKRGEIPKSRTFTSGGGLRQRGKRQPVEDIFDDAGDGGEVLEDVELENVVKDPLDEEDTQGKNKRERENKRQREIFPPPPLFIRPTPAPDFAGRRPGIVPKPKGQGVNPDTTPEKINDPVELKTRHWLRPEFNMLGTSYFDKKFALTPLKVENSEWTEFNYVNKVDRKNYIEIDNALNMKIRMKEPLFLPKLQDPLAPPTEQAIFLKQVPMTKQLQINQPFVNKFLGADMGRPMSFTETYNHSVFDFNFKNLKLYNPI